MPEAIEQCPACRRGVRSGTRFCPGCGQALEAPAPLQAPSPPRIANTRFAEHWGELKRVGWLFGLFLASSLVLGIASRTNSTPWPGAIVSAIDAVIIAVVVALRYPKLRFLFRLHPIGAGAWLRLAGIVVAAFAALSAYFWGMERAGVPIIPESTSFTSAEWPLWSMFVVISLMPAVFEELAFRGVIQSSLERALNARDAWLIQAALFSVAHLSPLVFPSHFVIGLCFGYLRRCTRSIYPGMVAHGSWNALVLFRELAA